MWKSNKKHSSGDINKKESKTVEISIKNLDKIEKVFLGTGRAYNRISDDIKISDEDNLLIDIKPYYDKEDKCVYIPFVCGDTREKACVSRFPIPREVIMECIRDCDETKE